MRKHWDQKEGILLHSIPYLENRRILKVFTKDAGLLLLIANAKKHPFAIPFCKAEWVYRISQTEIHSLKDSSLLDPMLPLKESFAALEAAGAIASDLLRSQLPNKTSHSIYNLLHASLAHLPSNPKAIAQSFRLKLLQLEGLLHLHPDSMHNTTDTANTIPFTSKEWNLFLILGLARRFSELTSLDIPASFAEKSNALFRLAIH